MSSIPHEIQKIYAGSPLLYTQEEVEAALDKMAQGIHELLHDKNPIVMGVMIGALIPMAGLLLRLNFPLEVDYLHATRYGSQTQGGQLTWKAPPTLDLTNRTVLVVDDILDGGITLAAIVEELKKSGAAHVYSAVLLDKYSTRLPEGLQHADFVGLEVDDHYVFGYGMDCQGYLRNAAGIYRVPAELLE